MSALPTHPPTDCPAWAKLATHADGWRDTHLAELFRHEPERGARFGAQAPALLLDYSRQRVGALTVRLLAQLAAERGLQAWRRAMFDGAPINSTEKRAVRHAALRAGAAAPAQVRDALARMRALAAGLRGVRRIVHLGTGGSDLGARLLMDALGENARHEVRFAANLDPLDLARALEGADPAATLVVAVSKTFTTAETLANAQAAKAWLGGRGRLYAVTANEGAPSAPPRCCRCGTGSAGASRSGRRRASARSPPSGPTPSTRSSPAAATWTGIFSMRRRRRMSRRCSRCSGYGT
jgi:hypothetical protein